MADDSVMLFQVQELYVDVWIGEGVVTPILSAGEDGPNTRIAMWRGPAVRLSAV